MVQSGGVVRSDFIHGQNVIVLSALIVLLSAPISAGPLPAFWKKLPPAGHNNLWYERNSSDTVFVFVHGIFSDSRTCWAYENSKAPETNQYWPEMVNADSRLEHPSIYLGGYYTAIDAGPYDAHQAVNELRDALKRDDVLQKPKIVFIAHSTGGIIVRYFLYHNQELFRQKQIGLVLYASPSTGAYLADTLSRLSEFYNQQLGLQLRVNSPFLRELDVNFRDLLYNPNSNPDNLRIIGAEAIENHFIIHRRFLPDRTFVVPEESGSRYFGSPRYLRNTDHFSTVKPATTSAPGHEFLLTFYSKFKAETRPVELKTPPVPVYEAHAYVIGRRVRQIVSTERFEKHSDSVNVGCEQDASTKVTFDIPSDTEVTSHDAAWVDLDNIKSHTAHSELKGRVVEGSGSIKGRDKELFNCPGGGHGTLRLSGSLSRHSQSFVGTPPIEIGSSEIRAEQVMFSALADDDLLIDLYRVDLRPKGTSTAFASLELRVSSGEAIGRIQQTLFGTTFRVEAQGRTLRVNVVSVKPPPQVNEAARPNTSFIRVSGSVVPIPKELAHISIEGKAGEWTINAGGNFDFAVRGSPGEIARVRIREGSKTVYNGFQDLSKPISVHISE